MLQLNFESCTCERDMLLSCILGTPAKSEPKASDAELARGTYPAAQSGKSPVVLCGQQLV